MEAQVGTHHPIGIIWKTIYSRKNLLKHYFNAQSHQQETERQSAQQCPVLTRYEIQTLLACCQQHGALRLLLHPTTQNRYPILNHLILIMRL